MKTTPPPQPKPAVFWALWVAILSGLPMIYFFLSGPPPATPAESPGMPIGLLAGLGPLVASIVIRWAVLPRITEAVKLLPIFVIGMASAQATGIIGVILGGEHKLFLFIMAILGVIQYTPLFAARLGDKSSAPSHTKVVK